MSIEWKVDKLKYKKLEVIKGLCNNCQEGGGGAEKWVSKGKLLCRAPQFAKSRNSSDPLLISSEFLLPPPPNTKYNLTVKDEKLENGLRYLSSDNPACAERFLREKYKTSHDDSNNRAVKIIG